MNSYPKKTFRKNLCHHPFAMISIFPEMKSRRTTIYRIKVGFSHSLLTLCSMHKVNSEHNVMWYYHRFFNENQFLFDKGFQPNSLLLFLLLFSSEAIGILRSSMKFIHMYGFFMFSFEFRA